MAAVKRALELDSNLAEAHAFYSHLLNILGRPEEAMEHIELALKLDPHNPTINEDAEDLGGVGKKLISRRPL
ncbi:MAG: hypothetical protein ACLFVG_09895 [Candidatus Aminicenantes bacterium]